MWSYDVIQIDKTRMPKWMWKEIVNLIKFLPEEPTVKKMNYDLWKRAAHNYIVKSPNEKNLQEVNVAI